MTDVEGIPGATIPTKSLTKDEAVTYIRGCQTILRAARLNNQYPDARLLSSHLGPLSPEVHQGLYDDLHIDIRSGLPSYKEWTRVQTDVRLAQDQLRQLGPHQELEVKARRHPDSMIHKKQLVKHSYYTSLARVQLITLGDMKVALRRLEPEARRAHFHIILDKLDVSGFFVRYSIDLAQTDDFWTERVVHLDEEAARHTETFRSLIYKFTSYDAEFTFVKLATMAGITVERVIKGLVGPFCFAGIQVPPAMQNLLGPGQLVAMFATDTAATDIAEDRDNDPFEDLIIDRLSAEARKGYEDARKKYGYHVFKDRKFVASRQLVEPLRGICQAEETKNIIYPI